MPRCGICCQFHIRPIGACMVCFCCDRTHCVLVRHQRHALVVLASAHSLPVKVGYTFVWRLNFINQVPLGSRDQFLAAAASRCQLPETRQLLMRLAERFRENQPWDPPAFHRESQTSLAAPGGKFGKSEDEKYDRSLNEMANAFLYPPSSALWSAVLQDFEHATQLREADVVHYLFLTTDYVFDHAASLPQCARLKTFREPRTKLASAANQLYFRWWNPISFRLWSIIWLLLLLVAGFVKQSPCQRWQANSVCGYLVHIRRDHGAVELFLLGNSTALYAAYDGTPDTFDDDFCSV